MDQLVKNYQEKMDQIMKLISMVLEEKNPNKGKNMEMSWKMKKKL